MLFIYKLHISQSQHLQKQCPKNGGMGYNLPLLKFPTATDEEKRDSTFNIRSIKHRINKSSTSILHLFLPILVIFSIY